MVSPSQEGEKYRHWARNNLKVDIDSLNLGEDRHKILEDLRCWIETAVESADWENQSNGDMLRYCEMVRDSLARGSDVISENEGARMPMRYQNEEGLDFEYGVFLPHGFAEEGRCYPLIIDLPGLGWVGKGAAYAEKKTFGNQIDDVLSIVVMKESVGFWDVESLDRFLDHIVEIYPVDENRIYLLGHSLGGNGAWDWAKLRPDRFAAISPCSSWCSERDLSRLRQTPVLLAHGENDPIVFPFENTRIGDKLESIGGKVDIWVLKNQGHNILTLELRERVVDWFLQHKRATYAVGNFELGPNV